MSSQDTILATSINIVPHLVALDLLMKKRLEAIDLDALLVYFIDTVSETALPELAKQFDVLGYKGMRLATTTQQKRDLIKKAIELHRYKGTVWAVREALKSIGYPNATITEHVTHWATFKVDLNVPPEIPITEAMIAEVVKMINEYKNTRSHLAGVFFEISFEDGVGLNENSYEAPGLEDEDAVTLGATFLYNGTANYDGSRTYSNEGDNLEIEILPA